jgi:hypothetical protein
MKFAHLTKIEFTNNNTYPIFYVENDLDLVFSNEPFIEELANKNGYWDFTIKIGVQSLEVTCNKKQKKVVNKHIVINREGKIYQYVPTDGPEVAVNREAVSRN